MYLAQSQTRKDNKCLRLGVLLLFVSGLQACALWNGGAKTHQDAHAPKQDVQVVAIGSIESEQSGGVPADLMRQLARVNVLLIDHAVPGVVPARWQYQWASADAMARYGLLEQARHELDALEAEIHRYSARYFRVHAERYFEQAAQFAFLTDDQAARLRALEFAMERGSFEQAYRDGRRLVQQLWSADAWVTARSGDTLARIAARTDVYDNYRLWPLLKSANPGYFIRSNAVAAGWRLRYPVHPRASEIFAVLEAQSP